MTAPDLPTGSVTFLFTDVAGSTRLFHLLGDRWPELLARHDMLMTEAFEASSGHVISHDGDGYFVAFSHAHDAVRAITQAQSALSAEPWPVDGVIKVRAGMHTGYAVPRDDNYVALAVHQAARVAAAAHPSQTLLTETVLDTMSEEVPTGWTVESLGAHRLKDFDVPQPIFELRRSGSPGFPPLPGLWRGANNLPLQRTTFVGRGHDQARVQSLLDVSRLVTIVGTGGAGKTRLATQVAAAMLDGTGDGAWLVELAGVTDPATVPLAVARALSLAEDATRDAHAGLIDRLRDKRLLIILDNCEHLIDACAELADALLNSCPGVHVLATSRQPLKVVGEQLYRLEPLGTPPTSMAVRLDEATRFEAVALFAERAALHDPRFVLDDETLPAVCELCRQLEGLPLALELAAARLRTLPVQAIASRLGDQMSLLVGSQRGVDARQQTVAATIDWSFGLLSATEQRLLTMLSVFRGWTLEAATSVCGEGGSAGEIEILLDSLVDKSLVQAESVAGEPRYSLLEPTRQYADTHPTFPDADRVPIAGRHTDYYLGLCELARRSLHSTDQRHWLERLDVEDANLQTARDAALADQDGASTALRFTAALASYWVMRGRVVEGLRYAERALDASATSELKIDRAEALVGMASLLVRAGDLGRARTCLTSARTTFEASEDSRRQAACLNELASLAARQGELDDATTMAQTALELVTESDEPHLHGRIYATLADLAERRGDLAVSRREAQHSQRLFDQVGDRIGSAKMLNNLGLLDLTLGDLTASRESLEACLTLFSEMQDAASLPTVLVNLGLIAIVDEDTERATELFTQGLRLGHRMADTELMTYAVLGLAMAADGRGDDARSAELHGLTDTLLAQVDMEFDALEERLRHESLARIATRSTQELVDAWRREGQLLNPEEALARELTYAHASAARGGGAG